MGKRKTRRRSLITLWRGKIARIIEQGSDAEVRTLNALIWHKGLNAHERYLILEGAIFDVWGRRMAEREAEARDRRKARRQQHPKVEEGHP